MTGTEDKKAAAEVEEADELLDETNHTDKDGEESPGLLGRGLDPDSILDALDIMTNHGISLLPVTEDGKFKGVVKLSDIFNVVAALLFDEVESGEVDANWISKYLHE